MFKDSAKLKETVDFVVAADSHSGALVGSEAEVVCPDKLSNFSDSHSGAVVANAEADSTWSASNPRTDASGPKRPHWHSTAQRFAIASIMLGSVLSYFCLHFLAGHFFWHFSGIQTTEYMHSTTDASTTGLAVTLFCYAEFLRGFLDFKHNIFSILVRILVATAVVVLGAFTSGTGGAMIAALCCLLCLGMGQAARLARAAIPSTFRAGRAVMVTAAASLPASVLSAFAFYHVITNPRPSNYLSIYQPSACGDEMAMAVVLFFFLAVPAYAFVRCARTSEKKPLVALGLLQMSPLAVGFIAQLAMVAPRDGGMAMFAGGLLSLAMAATLVASGSAMGAAVNGIKHRRKMSKAGI